MTSQFRRILYCLAALAACGGCAHRGTGTLNLDTPARALREVMQSDAAGSVRTFYRGEHEVLKERIFPDGRRVLRFSRGGRPVMVESDEDGDGFRETVTLYAEDCTVGEVFRRNANGNVVPIPTAELEELRCRIQIAVEALHSTLERAQRAGSGPHQP